MNTNTPLINPATFNPHPLIRNPHLQTIISSHITPSAPHMQAASQEMTLSVEAEESVRLQGFYSPQPGGTQKGLILLLHGWLGNANSSYMLGRGEHLYQQGYSIFRLNMLDHGDTIAWNEGLFHGGRIEEVFRAAHQIAALEPDNPFFAIGFSMGGSFALRIAWRHSTDPIPNLKHAIAVGPSSDPRTVTILIDRSRIYRPYFRQKWRRSLAAKQAAFPNRYDFSDMKSMKTTWEMTESIIQKYGYFPDIETYFQTYAFTPDKLHPIPIPTSIITAADDPVIAVDGFQKLANLNPLHQQIILPHGGHIGFINLFPFRYWLDEALLGLLEPQSQRQTDRL